MKKIVYTLQVILYFYYFSMDKLTLESISRFLAFTSSPKADYISLENLNSINLENNENYKIDFFKEKIIKYINEEIESCKIKDWQKIWILLSWWLDSTLLLHILKDKLPKSTFFTYTLWFNSLDPHLFIAKEIANSYNTSHREVIFDLDNDLFKLFNEVYSTWYNLEWEDSLIMNHILAKEVKKDWCNAVFSWFWLDYIFAWMDLFRNSLIENLYNDWLINKKYILETLNGNKYYLKYILDKINDNDLWINFFMKYWEYYWNILKKELQQGIKKYFFDTFWSIRKDISTLKKQIYYIIFTSLSNRYNPYNKPYEKLWLKHYNVFWSKDFIKKIIALNIPDKFLYNPYTKEKKYIIREISKDIIDSKILKNLHTWTVLKYENAFKFNKSKIIKIINENKSFLLNFYESNYIDGIWKSIDNSMWYEETLKIILLLQLIHHYKYNDSDYSLESKKVVNYKKSISLSFA